MKRNAAAALLVLILSAGAALAGDAPTLPETSVAPSRSDAARTTSSGLIPHARVTVALPPISGRSENREQSNGQDHSMPGIRPESETRLEVGAESPGAYAFQFGGTADNGEDDGGTAVKPAEEPETEKPVVLATVEGRDITDRDILHELWRRRGRETLEWMIGKAILDGELAKNGLAVGESEIDTRLAEHLDGLRRAFPNISDPDDLTRAAAGMRLDEYRERSVWVELALRKIMRATLKPTDDQLRAYYAERQAEFVRPERVKMSQLFIAPQGLPENDGVPGPADWAAAERQILEAHHRLRRGDDFATVARTYGAGGYASRWLERGELLRELEDAAFSLRPGAISAPLKTAIGFHIIRAEERQERTLPKFEDVRDSVEKQYEEKRFVLMAGQFMGLLRERAAKSGGLVVNETAIDNE